MRAGYMANKAEIL